MTVIYQALFPCVSIESRPKGSKLYVSHCHFKKSTRNSIQKTGGIEAAIESVRRCITSMTKSYNVFCHYEQPEKHRKRLWRQIEKDQKLLDELLKKKELSLS